MLPVLLFPITSSHTRKDTRPSPTLPYEKEQKAGYRPGDVASCDQGWLWSRVAVLKASCAQIAAENLKMNGTRCFRRVTAVISVCVPTTS